jgi:hypothetical protein
MQHGHDPRGPQCPEALLQDLQPRGRPATKGGDQILWELRIDGGLHVWSVCQHPKGNHRPGTFHRRKAKTEMFAVVTLVSILRGTTAEGSASLTSRTQRPRPGSRRGAAGRPGARSCSPVPHRHRSHCPGTLIKDHHTTVMTRYVDTSRPRSRNIVLLWTLTPCIRHQAIQCGRAAALD